MENGFDDLARAIGAPATRREAIRRLGGFVGAAVLASLGLAEARGRKNPCTIACRRCSGRVRQQQCTRACLYCPSTAQLCGPCGAVVCCGGGTVCSERQC